MKLNFTPVVPAYSIWKIGNVIKNWLPAFAQSLVHWMELNVAALPNLFSNLFLFWLATFCQILHQMQMYSVWERESPSSWCLNCVFRLVHQLNAYICFPQCTLIMHEKSENALFIKPSVVFYLFIFLLHLFLYRTFCTGTTLQIMLLHVRWHSTQHILLLLISIHPFFLVLEYSLFICTLYDVFCSLNYLIFI